VTTRGGLRLDEIAARLGGRIEGDPSVVVSQVAALASAKHGEITFLSDPKYRRQLPSTRASAVIVPPEFAGDTELPKIIHPNAYAC
jgi:UDP-3-O-[3-hydroxymyristoyl] glucosamine N-acyltransferase